MTSIERTAYPRFRRMITAAELHNHFAVKRAEVIWATEQTDSDPHLLALVLSWKCLVKMGRFPSLGEIPVPVVDFVRRGLGLPEGTMPEWGSDRIGRHHKALLRERVGITNDQKLARQIAETAIRSEAARKNNPPDLINVAVEKLIEASLELLAFSTLNTMTARIRTEVNQRIFHTIDGRLSAGERHGLERLLVIGPEGTSLFNTLKQPAKSPTWSHLREQVAHLAWVDSLGDTDTWVEGIAASKVSDFAGEAQAADAAVLGDYGRVKRIALIACLVHKARQRARDELVAMFCKRVALKVKAAKTELEAIHQRQRALTEALVSKFKTLLGQIDDDSAVAAMNTTAAELATRTITGLGARKAPDGAPESVTFDNLSASSAPAVAGLLRAFDLQAAGMDRIAATVAGFGGFAEVYSDIDFW
ncbi:MAG: DUF4158 domain-containing protein [Pseudonocardiales bacterium]|nr:DUF4158 domain-containing protein [Pseudonocardiales bacterium]